MSTRDGGYTQLAEPDHVGSSGPGNTVCSCLYKCIQLPNVHHSFTASQVWRGERAQRRGPSITQGYSACRGTGRGRKCIHYRHTYTLVLMNHSALLLSGSSCFVPSRLISAFSSRLSHISSHCLAVRLSSGSPLLGAFNRAELFLFVATVCHYFF